ncbi:MAG: cobalamin-binding protein [Candidatus Sungbacteria bacterium]|nr:cobalamin-binding protein [Candidatus Sungbacteria bacterium]
MRIISLAPSNTEILYALGLGNQIIAVTGFCDWPGDVRTKPRIGAWINTEPEKIKALMPDLIFTSYFIPEPLRNWSGPGALVHVEPKTLEGVYDGIRVIGETTDALKTARNVIEEMKQGFGKIAIQAPSERVRIYMEEWFAPPMASGNWVPELVEISGGRHAIAKQGESSAGFAFDELAQFDPDAAIFHWCGFGSKFPKEKLADRSKEWQELRMFRNNALYAIDDSMINRPGPRLVEGAQKIQETIKTYLKHRGL